MKKRRLGLGEIIRGAKLSLKKVLCNLLVREPQIVLEICPSILTQRPVNMD